MSLRRFEARSTPDALRAVRAALGPDAIILSNREHDGGVEIIATGVIDEALLAMASDVPVRASADAASADAVPSAAALLAGQDTVPVEPREVVAPATEPVDEAPEQASAVEAAPVAPEEIAPEALAPEALAPEAIATDTTSVAAAIGDPMSVGRDPAERASGGSDSASAGERRVDLPVDPSLAAEGLERVEARLRRLEVGLWGRNDEARADLLSKLMTLGLGPSLALRLSERASGSTDEALLRDAFATLRSSLPTVRDTTLERAGATLVAGPESESRLDVILKFAHRQIAAGGTRSLVLVSADAGRPGAFEVLEAAGRELGVATVRARDVVDLGRTLDSFSDRALVLVDAGRELPAGDVPVQVAPVPRRLVVLPATLQRVVAQRTARAARANGAHGCVLSRLDGAARLGEVLDALVREYLPVAWWSDQDAAHVPLQRADASVIVAAAVAMARRLGTGDDDVALATLMQPAELRAAGRFAGGVSLDRAAATVSIPMAEH